MPLFLLLYKNIFGSQLNFFTSPEQLKSYVSLSLFIAFFLIFDRNIVADFFSRFLASPPDCFITVPYDVPRDGLPTLYCMPPHIPLGHGWVYIINVIYVY